MSRKATQKAPGRSSSQGRPHKPQPSRQGKPLPKRTAPRPHPLRKALRLAKYAGFFVLLAVLVKSLMAFHPLERLESWGLRHSQQAGLQVRHFVLEDAEGAVMGQLDLQNCAEGVSGLLDAACFRRGPSGTVLFTPVHDILAALGMEAGQPVLNFDPRQARQALLALPWVSDAIVRRQLPATVAVRLTERRAAAYWEESPGRLWVVDGQGRRIVRKSYALDRFPLYVLRGAEAPSRLPELTALLARQPRIQAWVIAAEWVNGRRWTLTLRNGVEILLPETGAAAAFDQLAAEQERHKLFTRGFQRITILPDHSIVFTPLPQPDSKNAKKSAP